jgi:hypothetical protein
MKKKSLLLTLFVSLSTFAIAGAKNGETKNYNINLGVASKAGAIQLPAGQYKVKFDGSKAVFTDVNTNKSVTTDATLKNSTKKFNFTAVNSTKQAEGDRIDAIELGGSNAEIDFAY